MARVAKTGLREGRLNAALKPAIPNSRRISPKISTNSSKSTSSKLKESSDNLRVSGVRSCHRAAERSLSREYATVLDGEQGHVRLQRVQKAWRFVEILTIARPTSLLTLAIADGLAALKIGLPGPTLGSRVSPFLEAPCIRTSLF